MSNHDVEIVLSSLKGHCDCLEADGVDDLIASSECVSGKRVDGHVSRIDLLVSLKKVVESCSLCTELSTGRTHVVFGAGNANARLVFVSGAPTIEEATQGLPFVGSEGQLFDKMIAGIGLSREKVFISNILKCRPPESREPFLAEINNCEKHLLKQLDILQPSLICAFGATVAQALLKTPVAINKLRGVIHDYNGIPLVVTYHPAELLRDESMKKSAWDDLKMIRSMLCS